MSPRPMPPPVKAHADPDLESTAELPVLDAAGAAGALAAADEQHSGTDTWSVPPVARALAEAAAEHGEQLQALSVQLRETQELLANKGERLTQLEAARDEAQEAHANLCGKTVLRCVTVLGRTGLRLAGRLNLDCSAETLAFVLCHDRPLSDVRLGE